MNTSKKWVWGLIGAVTITALAGCASHRHEQEYQGGYGGAYGEQTYGNQYRALPNNPGAPGAPYEWQHVSPRPQMTP